MAHPDAVWALLQGEPMWFWTLVVGTGVVQLVFSGATWLARRRLDRTRRDLADDGWPENGTRG